MLLNDTSTKAWKVHGISLGLLDMAYSGSEIKFLCLTPNQINLLVQVLVTKIAFVQPIANYTKNILTKNYLQTMNV